MKNKNLKISDLKVKSFITTMENEEVNTVKGGLFSIGHRCSHANQCPRLQDTEHRTHHGGCQFD